MAPVVLVLIDGARPDAIAGGGYPALNALRRRGASTLRAQSIMPSITLPCHMSIFHSVPPARHGITDNNWMPMARPVMGLVDQARLAGLRSGFFYNWEPLRNLCRPGSLHAAAYRGNAATDPNGDHVIVEEAIRCLQQEPLDFLFVYLGTVDEWGHRYGWMSAEYLEQLAQADAAVGRLVATLPGDATILVQSDHGGHERMHGTDMAEDMTIPWILAGPNVKSGYEIEGAVSLLDTAPTLAKVLGVRSDRDWEGRVVAEAFISD